MPSRRSAPIDTAMISPALDPEGYGLRQGTIHRGRRDSTATALLLPALRAPESHGAHAQRRARHSHRGGPRHRRQCIVRRRPARRLLASREVLLCAGAVHSPQLLMLSGVGSGPASRIAGPPRHGRPRRRRRELSRPSGGADRARDARHHLLWVVVAHRCRARCGTSREYALTRQRAAGEQCVRVDRVHSQRRGAARPDIQIAFQPARRNPHAFPLPLGHGFAFSVVNLYPRSRGEVRLASSDPRIAPRVNPNILADPRDSAPLLRGLRLARQLCDTPAFAPYAATEVRPGRRAESDAELLAYLREATATVHHPVGSCRMGTDAMAVVDPALRVRGIDGLEGGGRFDFSEYRGRQHQRTDRDGGRKSRRHDHGAHPAERRHGG